MVLNIRIVQGPSSSAPVHVRGPAPVTVTVSEDERQRLDSWAHRSRSAPQVARRARIILACAEQTVVSRSQEVSTDSEQILRTRERLANQR